MPGTYWAEVICPLHSLRNWSFKKQLWLFCSRITSNTSNLHWITPSTHDHRVSRQERRLHSSGSDRFWNAGCRFTVHFPMGGKSEGGCCSNQRIEWAYGCTRHDSLRRCYGNCAQLSLVMLPHFLAHSLCRLLGAWPDASCMHRYCGPRRDVSRQNMSSFYFNLFSHIIPYRLHAGPILREVTWNCARLRNKKDTENKRNTKTIQEKKKKLENGGGGI